MKDSKDFDVNQFVPDSSPTETTAATGDTQLNKLSGATGDTRPSKSSQPTGRDETTGETMPPPSSEQTVPFRQIEPTQPTQPMGAAESTGQVQATQPIALAQPQRLSSRHRRASLDEYRATFLPVPKITDRQPVFVSRDVRDKIDSVVRRLGERKMSVSGFLENLAKHHLDLYADDLEQWRRL